MRQRWITLLGRIGTVLLMIGLALALVSQIPSAGVGSLSSSTFSVLPKKYFMVDSMRLTPQNGISISVESDGAIDVYILGVFMIELQNWTRNWVEEQFPNLEEPEIWLMAENLTALEAFIENHEGVVLKKLDKVTKLTLEFFPDTVSNVTTLVANPSLDVISLTWETKRITSLAPKERVFASAQWLIPIGIALTVPWLILTKTRKD